MPDDVLIRTENVKKLYMMGHEEVWALKGVTLDIYRGEFLSIMGPSGSGKSTFFNQVGALDVPTEGKVFFEDQSVFDLSESKQAWFRCNRIGFIFQSFNLIESLSALENVALWHERDISHSSVERVILPDGEQYKTLDVLNRIYTALLEARFDRRCTLVALGGGVVGASLARLLQPLRTMQIGLEIGRAWCRERV